MAAARATEARALSVPCNNKKQPENQHTTYQKQGRMQGPTKIIMPERVLFMRLVSDILGVASFLCSSYVCIC